MKNLGNLFKQAQQMQGKLAKLQEEMEAKEFTGNSGGGMVEITMTGKQDVKKVRIDPELMNSDDVEMLEDLIAAAFHDVKKKVNEHTQEQFSSMAGGIGLPGGMNLPF
ncbi:YbaB/EbfC family nucleoid-associated protein [Magnetococcales bacterium HHB-1]